MNKRLHLLKDGPSDGVGRHQTLRAAIDWSFRLLLQQEQLLFARLAIFRGRWSLSTVEVVFTVDPTIHPLDWFQQSEEQGRLHDFGILDSLNALIEKSLVIQHHHHNGSVFFSMLETLREYAAEQLAHSGEAHILRQRHISYYLALAEAAEPHLVGAHQGLWFERLEYEHDNLREALESALAIGANEMALRFCAALRPFWQMQNHIREGYHWTEATLLAAQQSAEWAANEPSLLASYAKACHSAGILAYLQGNYADAEYWLIVLAAIIWQEGDQAAAVRLWGAAEALAEMLGTQLLPTYHSLYQQTLEQARASLPPALFAQEWAAGLKMSFDQAIQYAQSVVAQAQYANAEPF